MDENGMTYFDELVKAMAWLGEQEDTVFVGQSCRWEGHALFKTMKEVSMDENKRIEMPVIEDMQMGFSTGLALQGFVPISIFPRWDFLLLAANQLVNHLDKIPDMSNYTICPKVIIRTTVGSREPLDPGHQHRQDHTEAFRKMLDWVDVVKLEEPDLILPAYQNAYLSDRSTLIVEVMDYYNTK